MTTDTGPEEFTAISPHKAFDVLGDKTRLQVLQTLGQADEPLAFSELYEQIEYDDASNFNYHLGKLTGHFIRKSDEGYTLRQAGCRVLEAILSGAVTETPVIERAPIETPCFLCGGQLEVSYHEEHIGIFCTDCGGTRGGSSATTKRWTDPNEQLVGNMSLPPAGVHDRTPTELLQAAELWTVASAQLIARGVCSRCSATIDHSVRVCDDHDATDGHCEECDQQFAVNFQWDCTNCIIGGESSISVYLMGNTDLIAFMTDHGVDPLAPGAFPFSALEETVVSTDPFEARFTFTADEESITLTVDDDLSVVDGRRHEATVSV